MAIAIFATKKFAVTEKSFPGAWAESRTIIDFIVLNRTLSYWANQVRTSWVLLNLSRRFSCFRAEKILKGPCAYLQEGGGKGC